MGVYLVCIWCVCVSVSIVLIRMLSNFLSMRVGYSIIIIKPTMMRRF